MQTFEPHPGGALRLTLTYDRESGSVIGKSSEYTDAVHGRFVDDPAFAGTMRMAWSLEPADGGTVVSIAAINVPPGITAKDHVAGLRSTLANLVTFVEEATRFRDR